MVGGLQDHGLKELPVQRAAPHRLPKGGHPLLLNIPRQQKGNASVFNVQNKGVVVQVAPRPRKKPGGGMDDGNFHFRVEMENCSRPHPVQGDLLLFQQGFEFQP